MDVLLLSFVIILFNLLLKIVYVVLKLDNIDVDVLIVEIMVLLVLESFCKVIICCWFLVFCFCFCVMLL